jgi:hypothetical protein
MWKFFQLSIFFAVMLSDSKYEWSTGPLVAPFCAVSAAWLSTAAIIAVVDLSRRARAGVIALSAYLAQSRQQPRNRWIR